MNASRTPSACSLVFVLALACGGANQGLNQTSVTCPAGRTLLDGVCVAEAVADYVACVRAQGAQLGAAKSEKISAEAGYLGARAGGAAEVRENLEKRYSASDAAMLEIIRGCNATAHVRASTSAGSTNVSGDWEFVCEGLNPARDIQRLQQTGTTVVATSPRFAPYRAEGSVTGSVIAGRWTNVGPATGRFEYTLDSTGQLLNGSWGHGEDSKQFKCVAKRM